MLSVIPEWSLWMLLREFIFCCVNYLPIVGLLHRVDSCVLFCLFKKKKSWYIINGILGMLSRFEIAYIFVDLVVFRIAKKNIETSQKSSQAEGVSTDKVKIT